MATTETTKIRSRILELKEIPVSQLRADPRNWRIHPEKQKEIVQAVMGDLGNISPTVVRLDPEEADVYIIVDGHLRSLDVYNPTDKVPCVVVDLDEAEAGKALATVNPLADLAKVDGAKLENLIKSASMSQELKNHLKRVAKGTDGPSPVEAWKPTEKEKAAIESIQPAPSRVYARITVSVPAHMRQKVFDELAKVVRQWPEAEIA